MCNKDTYMAMVGVPDTFLLHLQEVFPLEMYYLLVTTWHGNILLGIMRHILLLQARKAEAIDFHPLWVKVRTKKI